MDKRASATDPTQHPVSLSVDCSWLYILITYSKMLTAFLEAPMMIELKCHQLQSQCFCSYFVNSQYINVKMLTVERFKTGNSICDLNLNYGTSFIYILISQRIFREYKLTVHFCMLFVSFRKFLLFLKVQCKPRCCRESSNNFALPIMNIFYVTGV